MKSEKLLDIIGEAKESYVLSALDSRNGQKQCRRRLALNRTMLIAAAIALTLLLVGCTVAYVLHLQGLKIAEEAGYSWFDSEGHRTEKTEVVWDILSIRGAPGSPNQLAAQEWFATTFEVDYSKIIDPNSRNIPENLYYTYRCFTWEMADKVNEIMKKYDLKPLSIAIPVQSWQSGILFDAMGISGMCRNNSNVQETTGSGIFYPEGDFYYNCEISLNEDGAWNQPIIINVFYSRKDYFNPEYLEIQTDDFEQWKYKTSDGTSVLLAKNNLAAFIFTEQSEAYITIALSASPTSPIPVSGSFSKRDIELAADGLNLSMHPKAIDTAAIQPLLDAADAKWEASHQTAAKADYSQYTGYTDFLLDYMCWGNQSSYYAIYDINDDHIDELLLGSTPDTFEKVMTQVDGIIVEYLDLPDSQLCEGQVLRNCMPSGYYGYTIAYSSFEKYAAEKDPPVNELETLTYHNNLGQWTYNKGVISGIPISEKDVEEVQGKYPIIPIQLYPIRDYPIDENGTTMGEYAHRQTDSLSRQDRLALYREVVEKAKDSSNYSYFGLVDLNGDGIDELLLSDEKDHFGDVYTMFNGQKARIAMGMHFTLCQDDILQHTEYDHISQEPRSFSFYRLNDYVLQNIEIVEHDLLFNRWFTRQSDDPTSCREITEAEANEIIAKYKQVDVTMQPLSDFSMK